MNQPTMTYSEVVNAFLSREVTEFQLDVGSGKLTYKTKTATEAVSYSVPDPQRFLYDIQDFIDYANSYNVQNPNAQIKYTLSANRTG